MLDMEEIDVVDDSHTVDLQSAVSEKSHTTTKINNIYRKAQSYIRKTKEQDMEADDGNEVNI